MADRDLYFSEWVVRAGERLYGEGWKKPLARDLGVERSTMQRIAAAAAAGEPYRVSAAMQDKLTALVRQRERELKEVWFGLKKGCPA